MISDELNRIERFSKTNGEIDLTPPNVYLAETVFSIYYRNSKLRETFKRLESNYSIKMLEDVCAEVNKENSTHLRDYEKIIIAKELFANYPSIDAFKCKLKEDDYPLVYEIRSYKWKDAKKVIEGFSSDKNSKVRDNYSFATKLCHYACYNLFEDNDKDRDRYPIYDSVLEKYVKKSKAYKNSDRKDIDDYRTYVDIVDKIIEGKGISRNGFDHLIWLATREVV